MRNEVAWPLAPPHRHVRHGAGLQDRAALVTHSRFHEITSTMKDFQTEWWYYTGNVKSAERPPVRL